MKEVKNYQIKCRITQSDKEKIIEYCQKHDINMSEFIRLACERMTREEEE